MGQITIGIALLVCAYAVSNPKRFLVIIGLILASPYLIVARILLFAFQTTSKHTESVLNDGRITLFLKLQLKLHKWFWNAVTRATSLINNLVREEMIEINSGKSSVVYVPVSEREKPASEQTTFTMRRLSKGRLAEFKDLLIRLGKTGRVDGLNNRSVRLAITREMLDGWTNMIRLDETGKVVQVNFNPKDRHAMYELIPEELSDELEARFGDGSLDWEKAEEDIADQEAEAEELIADLSASSEEEA